MPTFLVEVKHEATKEGCDRAIRLFLETGFHFMTNADWGCEDGEHTAWFILDIDSKEDARNILPPEFRRSAKIVKLRKFSINDIQETMNIHNG
jgi:hypothetical protein